MNFINPIPNAEFQIGIVCALMCIMFIFLYVGVKLINRIEELRADMVQEDAAWHKETVAYAEKISDRTERAFREVSTDIIKIEQHLNRPLYEVGNTIWFNKGNTGTPGVFPDEKGVIIEISPALNGPWYNVQTRTHIESIPQSLITTWTN